MAISRNTTVTAIGALSIAVAIAGFQLETTRALAVPAPQGPMGNSAFLGAWCAQGDPTKGTYWTRCSGGGGHRTPNLDRTWYRGGDRSQSCNIRQRKRNLQLRNESGQSATGSVDRRGHVTTYWSGTQIGGTLSPDGDTIYWDNGTSWSR
jgi:hypothetical protein